MTKLCFLFLIVLGIGGGFTAHFSGGFLPAGMKDWAPMTKAVKPNQRVHAKSMVSGSINAHCQIWETLFFGQIKGNARDGGGLQSEIPVKVRWQLLTSIKYEPKYFPQVEMEMLSPVFTDTLKKLNGKLIEIEGYVIPFDESTSIVALSANPYASCFFCGKASPASVMTLKIAYPGKRFKTDEFLRFVGRLRLNFNDPQEFYYVLEKARIL